jgi:hypothetical protein
VFQGWHGILTLQTIILHINEHEQPENKGIKILLNIAPLIKKITFLSTLNMYYIKSNKTKLFSFARFPKRFDEKLSRFLSEIPDSPRTEFRKNR